MRTPAVSQGCQSGGLRNKQRPILIFENKERTHPLKERPYQAEGLIWLFQRKRHGLRTNDVPNQKQLKKLKGGRTGDPAVPDHDGGRRK